MDRNKPTLAIYGIQDRQDSIYPLYVHDHNLTLMQDGRVNKFLQQERISRIKRDNSLHIHLKDILKEQRMLGQENDLVFVDNVVGRTFLLQNGEIRFEAPMNTSLSTDLEKGRCWWFGREQEAYVLNHEMAHMFSALPFVGKLHENSLLVHFDGGASLSNFSACHYKDGQFKWLEYHWDLKPFSGIFNANGLVFSILGAKLPEQNAVPGKFMGFAGLGKPNTKIKKWLFENQFFHDIWGRTSVFFEKAKTDFGHDLRSFSQKDSFIQDVAATLQEIFIEEIQSRMGKLARDTKAEYLYYTGGSALNIVANTEILKMNLFKDVFIPPCTEDSGLSLGAAAFMEWKKHGQVSKHPAYLNNWKIQDYEYNHSPETIKLVAEMILASGVVGLCNGLSEAGPRALGNRSIIALANSKNLAKNISMDKKGREWYRPLAPVMLEKNALYFTGLSKIPELSKFMLMDFSVEAYKQNEILGAMHADGTARIQTLFKREDNPFLYDLLNHLDEAHGIRALINTSFNGAGEPIVHTVEDARASAHKLGLNGLVLNGQFVNLLESGVI